ncbi:MAG: hypothetical protein EOP62_11110 [Sphingomonadales bacterium]|nr:MAG: hypothetical protein EOP62_11110 [Sphingomonadales bacterium]
MRLYLALPLLLLYACHAPTEAPAPADPVNEATVEQSMENSQFSLEDQIINEAVADNANS